jgi:carbonic anhydrase/acetyltransferase-like protein (isoleucine patch superfamily)
MSYITASEARNVIIGNDCLFSLNAWFRTSDGHAAYDGQTKKRINGAASILIGDHVWLGQDVTVLKGSRIGSGSIIGAGSIVTGKTLSSNTSCAGAPARELKNNIFFTKPNINGYDQQKLETIATEDTDEWMYKRDENTLSFDEIDKDLSELQTSAEKLAYFRKNLAGKASKNRFYIGDDKKIS